MSRRHSKLGDSNRMFSYLRVVGASNGSAKLQGHCTMCLRKLLVGLFCLPLFAQSGPSLTPAETEARDDGAAKLRAIIEASPKLQLEQTDLLIELPKGQELGMVSWLARDAKTGVTWLIQRGDKADPVMAVDREGRVLHSFGKGLYKIPHAIRLDLEGNVWTVDAGSSTVIKFSPKGKKLLEIDVGGQPDPERGPVRGLSRSFPRSHRYCICADGTDFHQRRLRQRAHPRVHGRWQEGSRVGQCGHGSGAVPSAALDRSR